MRGPSELQLLWARRPVIFARVPIAAIATMVRAMNWERELIDELAIEPRCAYRTGDAPATEPTALASLALSGFGCESESRLAGDWLVECQSASGSVGVRAREPMPRWPTSLAVLAWKAIHDNSESPDESYADNIDRGIRWILGMNGDTKERTPAAGHDPTLAAWPWVEGTHSWIEPTSLHVIALKSAGYASHSRTREAVDMLLDRQLPRGGCNYGNTVILGQTLRPHIQPSGLALLAFAGESDRRVEKTIAYLRATLSAETTTTSLCWGLLGLAAHDRLPPDAADWLECRYENRSPSLVRSPYGLSLLANAAMAEHAPLIRLCRGDVIHQAKSN